MNVEIEPYSALPCELKVFKINGIDASMDDFGDSRDTAREHAADYMCGCHEFIPLDEHMKDAMFRYQITEEEFRQIQEELVDVLYVGSCGCCI